MSHLLTFLAGFLVGALCAYVYASLVCADEIDPADAEATGTSEPEAPG